MGAQSYDVRTIVGLARIPEDRLAACLAELPRVIPHVRAVVEMVEAMHAAAGIDKPTDEKLLEAVAGLNWVDDDKGNIDVNVKLSPEEGEPLAEIKIHQNHKTGAASFSASGDFPGEQS